MMAISAVAGVILFFTAHDYNGILLDELVAGWLTLARAPSFGPAPLRCQLPPRSGGSGRLPGGRFSRPRSPPWLRGRLRLGQQGAKGASGFVGVPKEASWSLGDMSLPSPAATCYPTER